MSSYTNSHVHIHMHANTKGIICGGLGTLTGAFISHCVKIGKNIAIINWVTTFIAIFPLIGFFLYCPNLDIVGINVEHNNRLIYLNACMFF